MRTMTKLVTRVVCWAASCNAVLSLEPYEHACARVKFVVFSALHSLLGGMLTMMLVQ